MRGLLAAIGLAVAIGGVASGCYFGPAPGHCPGGYWIEGHYDRYGRWHRPHWRCPGVYEVE
jgi:hypothetical protein